MRRGALLLAVLGFVLVVVGVMVARQPRPQFGWTAYTPLSQATLSPGAVVLDAVGITALALAGVGVALVAGAVGYSLGRKNARSASGFSADSGS